MVGIYKITNIINNKSYIGQSVDIDRRWRDHKNESRWEEGSYLNRAFSKYGIENFNFTILEECRVEDLDKLEELYISEYQTYHNGYNLTLGGVGARGVGQKLDYEKVREIMSLISQGINFEEISNRYNCSSRTIRSINVGAAWRLDDVIYPINPKNIKRKTKEKLNVDDRPICECGERYGSGKMCVKCTQISQRKVERPSKEWLIENIATRGFEDVGREFGVSGNSIKKWCKAYEIPHMKQEIINLYKSAKTS